MKNLIFTLTAILFSVCFINLNAQTFEIRVINNDYGYLEVQMKETSGIGTPTASTIINDISIEVRWLTNTPDADIDLICAANDYNLADAINQKRTQGSYSYRVYQATSTPFNCPTDWTVNAWETITTFKAPEGNGIFDFDIAPNFFVPQGLNWNQGSPVGIDYTPTINGYAPNHLVPTVEYDYVWVGGNGFAPVYDEHSWSAPANWCDICGDPVAAAPSTSDNCLIPGGLTYYPENVDLMGLFDIAAYNVRVLPGAYINMNTHFPIAGNLRVVENDETGISGQFIISPNNSVTVDGFLQIEGEAGLLIQADEDGVGSFIDEAYTNAYGPNGSARIETYIGNSTDTYFHEVGATVNSQVAGQSGVMMRDFMLSPMHTFIYEWDEPGQSWSNPYYYEIAETGEGFMLTTDDGSTGTLEQDGQIINSDVTLALNQHGDPNTASYGWNLKSNPYSAALDWDAVWTRESSSFADLNSTIYVLNDGNHNYASFNAQTGVGLGMTKDVQVGQGFWVQSAASSWPSVNAFTLKPEDRVHSNVSFLKDVTSSVLSLTVEGNNSLDIFNIMFRDYGTSGYDRFVDVYKWDSPYEEATEMWTVAGDQSRLSSNVLGPLGNTHTEVPAAFKCSANGEYVITASDLKSFEGSVEIYIEDLLTGGEWHNLGENPVYTFNATPNDPLHRFVIHFFGVTGVEDPVTEVADIRIWSNRTDAFIVNNGDEVIKEYVVYDLMGREVKRGTLANSTLNKIHISETSAHFIVKAITKDRIYSEKILITK